ncbi:MAG: hypothetical protein Q7S79_02795 [bacterium]|nr:hypothetical protein [bacterium]
MILTTTLAANICGFGPLGLCKSGSEQGAATIFDNAMSKTVGFLTICGVLWFVFQFFLGAFKWISSGGDSKAVEAARTQITHAVVGLSLVFIALVVVQLMAELFGFKGLLDLDNIIRSLKP